MKEYSRDTMIEAMKEYFGNDTRRINHALNVLSYAEEIQKTEGGDLKIVETAAILHDIGIPESEKKYSSSAGNYQEIEGPPVANEIMRTFEFSEDDIFHVCRIIANHHSDKDIDTIEFRIIWDADWLVNIPDEFDLSDKKGLERLIKSVFKTETGLKIATNKYINNNNGHKTVI